MSGVSVLLTTDGTYPCYPGGVSVWCDQMIRQLQDVDFHVFAVTYSPSDSPRFACPPNVRTQYLLPLWGTEEPGPPENDLGISLRRRQRTTEAAIRHHFVKPLELCLRAMLRPDSPPEQMADALVELHVYFRHHDCLRSMASGLAWETFLRICRDIYPRNSRPTLQEAMTCMRWMQRHLALVAADPVPTEIVHASMAGLASIPGVLQKRCRGSRFLLSEHGIFLRELYLSLADMKESPLCRRFLYSWHETIARMSYRYADAVSSLCEFNRKWQIRVGAQPDKIRIIPNGVDPSVFHPPQTGSHHLQGAGPVVLTMARIFPLKGIDNLLRAARLVLEKEPAVRWRILGEPSDQEYYRHCRELAGQLGIAACVEWDQTCEPGAAYRAADIFCLPSISEALPYCVLEAMFSGCPVVATDVGGVAEMLAGSGLVVPPRDPESLARAILSLVQGESAAGYRQDLAAKALARARACYTIEKCSGRFREVYDQLSEHTKVAALSAAG
jgi:polysaccharide biosynthesis protein PelF